MRLLSPKNLLLKFSISELNLSYSKTFLHENRLKFRIHPKMAQIENLPLIVLENIFCYVPNRLELRLVCSTFSNIIDNSGPLLQKYILNVSKISYKQSTFQLRIRKLMFERLGQQEFNWIQNYEPKGNIIWMKFDVGNKELEKSAEFLQYILSNFKSVREFFIRIYDADNSNFNPIHHLKKMISNWLPSPYKKPCKKLYPVESSKLKSITLCGMHSINDIMNMFSDIPTIKILEICNHTPPLRFPGQVAWNLEKLQFNYFQDNEIECQRILESQKPSLKMIELFSESICNYVMTNHPAIENLSLYCGVEDVDHLDPNGNLKSLKLYNSEANNRWLEHLLRHYRFIKYLRLDNDSDFELKPFTNIYFENLTHLSLDGLICNFLMSAKMPNLKNLEISCARASNTIDFSMIPYQNLENIEKLSLKELGMDQRLAITMKCTKLQHLNVGSFFNVETVNPAKIINQVVSKAPQLKVFGILERILKNHDLKYEELLSQMKNRRLIVKVYSRFGEMANENWEPNYSSTMDIDYYEEN
ncbi:unnamed protein product [Chironomus riparius]|uniref:F-box domain-containing protein n=1 Tax=Chironomus riparius TaxID=315576 RepID=A0A9N9WWM8_9DIPT|nr:unnamed protein product [Chironomus riparius]